MSQKGRLFGIAVVAVAFAVFLALGVPWARAQAAKPKTVTLKIEGQGTMKGMVCDGCKRAVESALTKVDGVSKVEVDLKEGKCAVQYDRRKVRETDLQQAVESTKMFRARVLEGPKWWHLARYLPTGKS